MRVSFNSISRPAVRFGNHQPSSQVVQVAAKVSQGLLAAGFQPASFALENSYEGRNGQKQEFVQVLYDADKPQDFQSVIQALGALPNSAPAPSGNHLLVDNVLVKVSLLHPDFFPQKPPIVVQ